MTKEPPPARCERRLSLRDRLLGEASAPRRLASRRVSDLAFNLVDAVVLALAGLAVVMGFRTGFVDSLALWIFAVAAALAFQRRATTLIEFLARLPKPLAATIAFVVTIVVVEGSSRSRATSRSDRRSQACTEAR